MKTSTSITLKTCFALTALGLLASGFVVNAEDYVRYKAKPNGSSVKIDGAANIHNWSMEGSIIGGYLEIPAGLTLDSTQADVAGAKDGKIAMHAEVRMPVTSINNAHFDGMNEVMQDAMKAKEFPAIEYRLTDATLKLPHAANTPLQLDTKGEVSLHGVTNKIAMTVSIETVDKTKLKIVGAAIPLKMTDFGIKPPVKAGIFTTEDEVKISFEWIVGLSSKPK